MTVLPTIVVTPSTAAEAYGRHLPGVVTDPTGATLPTFGDTVAQAVTGAVATGENAETQAMKAISGGGNMTEVVTTLSRAEMTLQTATVIRDKVVQAYQDIMKMPI